MDTLHIPWIDMKRRELDFDFPVPALTCDSFKQGNMRYTTTQNQNTTRLTVRSSAFAASLSKSRFLNHLKRNSTILSSSFFTQIVQFIR